MAECEIKFEQNPFGIYFSGQTLNGLVVLTLQKPKKVRGICLKINGVAQCEWSERHSVGVGKNRRTRTVFYKGREDYLASTTFLVGSELAVSLLIHGGAACQWSEQRPHNSDNNINDSDKYQGQEEFINTHVYLVPPTYSNDAQPTVIMPGIHTYSFNCTLPQQLPTSFEGSKGHIRYTVKVGLERPWKFDQTYRVAFTVLKQIDLNYETPVLRIPSQGEVTKTFWCGPCKSPPMNIRASIPQTGYVPGQIVVVTTEISNQSRIGVEEVKFSLRQIIHYHSQSPHMKTLEDIVDICEQRKSGFETKELCQMKQDIAIPAIPPTISTLSRVIQINYEIKVEVKVKGAHINPMIRIPITIGTVPLQSIQQPIHPALPLPLIHHQQPLDYNVPQPIIQPIQNHRGINEQSELPPPTYEETINGSVDVNDHEEHPLGLSFYAPRYPVYNAWNLQPPESSSSGNLGRIDTK